jgi:hypothetical protein
MGYDPRFSRGWVLADVLGLFSPNVGSFSANVVPSARIVSANPVPKRPMLSSPAIYVLGPQQLVKTKASYMQLKVLTYL